jgi:hypothetical protein
MHSLVQYGYLAALLLGVIGIPYARVWFRKLWPPERRDDFKGVAGLALAKAVRGAAFVFVFVPLVAFASAPLSLLRSAWDQLTGLALIVSWPFRALARGLAPKG